MPNIKWPKEYEHAIPKDACAYLEMYDSARGNLIGLDEFWFYLGRYEEKGGIAICMLPKREKRYMIEMSFEQMEDIQKELLDVKVGFGPRVLGLDGSDGTLRVAVNPGCEVVLSWSYAPPASWKKITNLINRIKYYVLNSPKRIELKPLRGGDF